LFGRNFKQGIYYEQASPIDIAATLAAALGIDSPPTREGRILKEAMK
jgi:arylsulfatase A-like enzyme